MKCFRKIVAIAVVIAMISAFALIFPIYAYTGHLDFCTGDDCFICMMFSVAEKLLHFSVMITAGFFLMTRLLFFSPLHRKKECFSLFRKQTPVTLKTKITG